MPTKTRDPIKEAKRETTEAAKEAEALRHRLDDATAKIRAAEEELAGIRDKQEDISLSVVSGDEAAVEESRQLSARAYQLEQHLRTLRSGVARLSSMVEDAESRAGDAEKVIHLARAGQLGRERYRIAQRAQGHLDALKADLEELEAVDREQRNELYLGGRGDGPHVYTTARQVIEQWLTGSLGGYSNYIPGATSAAMDWYRGRTLYEVDGLAYGEEDA